MTTLAIDRISEPEVDALLRGKRLGVISAASGLSASLRYPLDLLRERYDVAALFAPEHGVRGMLGPGEGVRGGKERFSSLPVYSLFEDFFTSPGGAEADRAYQPAPEALDGIDAMVFEMQDAGARFFTYSSTLFYCMRACAARALPLIVLYRPNPLGGTVGGGGCGEGFRSFIGIADIPLRHGLTLGELARWFNGECRLGCPLTVVPMRGWSREMLYDDTGLPFVPPSPNLPSTDALLAYPGTCLLAGTNVSDGRGTTTPFTVLGAPFIDPFRLAEALNAEDLPGVSFSPAFFSPLFSRYAGEPLYGVRLHFTSRRSFDPVRCGVTLVRLLTRLYPDDFRFTPPSGGERWHIDLSSGSSDLRMGTLSAPALLAKWQNEAEAFKEKAKPYLMYR